MKKRYEELVDLDQAVAYFTSWDWERGFYDTSQSDAVRKGQVIKLGEEFGELCANIARGKDIKDDIGDMVKILNTLAFLHGTNLRKCCEISWNDIKDRKGIMVNGVYIKESDLNKSDG